VLLFSQWTSVLDVLEWFLHERGMLFYRLDGSTNVRPRARARARAPAG
jgi:SWI/SNF-related matrix-associated actin-dependent regulator 1 of chromatin subfamily A